MNYDWIIITLIFTVDSLYGLVITEFLDTDPEVSGSIPGAIRFPEK